MIRARSDGSYQLINEGIQDCGANLEHSVYRQGALLFALLQLTNEMLSDVLAGAHFLQFA
jgi:hypothetical protein